jgi:hypothetical protein
MHRFGMMALAAAGLLLGRRRGRARGAAADHGAACAAGRSRDRVDPVREGGRRSGGAGEPRQADDRQRGVRQLQLGNISLDDEYVISVNAWRKGGAPSGGSTMYAALHSKVKVEDLLKGVMIQSANDGCIALAEGIAGNETNSCG